MTVRELIKELQKYDQDREVLINSYYIDADYDWGENLELSYIEEIIPPEISERDGCVYLSWGTYG